VSCDWLQNVFDVKCRSFMCVCKVFILYKLLLLPLEQTNKEYEFAIVSANVFKLFHDTITLFSNTTSVQGLSHGEGAYIREPQNYKLNNILPTQI